MVDKNTGAEVIFLCDGKACPEDKKVNCFTQQPEERTLNSFTHEPDKPCRHTTDIRHAVNFEDFHSDGTAFCEIIKEELRDTVYFCKG